FFLLLIFNRRRWVFVVTCLTAIAALIGICLENNEFSPAGIHNHPPPWRDLTRCFSQFLLGLAVYRIYASGRFTDFFRRDSVVLILSAAILGIIGLRLGDIFAMLLFPPLLLCLTLNTGRIARIMATR